MKQVYEYTNYAWTAFTIEELERLNRAYQFDWQPYQDEPFIPDGLVEYVLVQGSGMDSYYYFRSTTDERMCKVNASLIWESAHPIGYGTLARSDIAQYFSPTTADGQPS